MNKLDELVTEFGTVKEQADVFKKESDSLNKQIKEEMTNSNLDSYSAGGYTVKLNIKNKEYVDEDKMVEVLQKYWSSKNGSMENPFIIRKPVLNSDALESAIYHGELPDEILAELAGCKTVKGIPELRIKKNKEEK